MEGFRNRRQKHDGLSAWQLPAEEYQFIGWNPKLAEVRSGLLAPIAGDAKIADHRGIFMTTDK